MVVIFYLIGQCSTDRKVRGERMSDRQQMGYMVPGPPALPGELQGACVSPVLALVVCCKFKNLCLAICHED